MAQTIALRIDDDWYQFLKSKAEKEDRSMSSMIRLAIRDKLLEVKNE